MVANREGTDARGLRRARGKASAERKAAGAVLHLGVCALLVACSPAEPERLPAGAPAAELAPRPKARAGEGSAAPAPAAAERAFAEPPRALGAWRPREAEWMAGMRERVDPARAGWTLEAAAQELEAALGALLTRALAQASGPGEPAGLDALLAEGCRVDALPEELTVLFDDGSVRVARAPTRAQREAGARALDPPARAAWLASWRARLLAPAGAGASPEVELRVVSSREGARGGLEAELVLRAWARGEAGAVQHNARWRVESELDARGQLGRVRALEVLEHEEVRAPPSWLCERTHEAFGALEAWAAELAPGNDALMGRSDRNAGELVLGMHGLAVGDLDGDGREDLYVAQPAGQRNLLLLRTEGGAYREAPDSAAALLDATAGVLAVDLDGDGLQDLALALGEDVVVLWNDAEQPFVATTRLPSGDPSLVYSLSSADADGDGDLDLYVCRYSVGEYLQSRAAESIPVPYHDAHNGATNFLWRNEGARVFSDATAQLGLDADNTRFSLASIWEDLDGDGALDLYVVNDFGTNQLFRRVVGPDGVRYVESARALGLEDMAAGMGVSVADVDLDGVLDLLVSNMYAPAGLRMAASEGFRPHAPAERPRYERHARGNTLLLGLGEGRYRDATESAGLGAGGWAWGARFVDLNADGLDDVYVPDGFLSGPRADDLESAFWRECVALSPVEAPVTWEYFRGWAVLRYLTSSEGWSWNGHERNYAYLNLGGGRFADVSAASGSDERDDGRVALALDWDEDGRLDLLVRNRTGPRLRLWRNAHAAAPRALSIELVGRAPNTDAIGALVELELAPEAARGRASGRLARRVHAGDGYLGNSSRRLHFALGQATRAERVRVRWPSGATLELGALEGGARWRIDERTGAVARVADFGPGAAGECARLPTHPIGPGSRVALLDRLPLAPLALTTLDGVRRELVEGGRGALVAIGSWGDPGSREQLRALARERAALEAAGSGLVLWLLDSPQSLRTARPELEALGVARACARLDAAGFEVLRALALEVLGQGDGLPLPAVLVLDRGAGLCAMHASPLEPAALLADAARAAEIDPEQRDSGPFLRGRWLAQPERSLGVVSRSLQLLGQPALARAYEQLAGARAAR